MAKRRPEVKNYKRPPEMLKIECSVPGCDHTASQATFRKNGWAHITFDAGKAGRFRLDICNDHHGMLALNQAIVAEALSIGLTCIFMKQEAQDELY